ncbi:MAG: S9 family peptidase [Bacteroidaceae bacterium]|nr:S9 family peptidase [Bacteroidaceae bacterium]
MKKQILLAGVLCASMLASAENVNVKSFRYAGPYAVQQPYMVDSVDVNSKAFAMKNLLDTPLDLEQVNKGTAFDGEVLPNVNNGYALHLLGFTLQSKAYTKATLKVEGIQNYQIYVNGKKQNGADLTLEPATHPIVIKYLSEAGKNDNIKVSVETEKDGLVTIREDGKRNYTLADVLHGTRFSGVSFSPNGKYLMISYRTTQVGGRSSGYTTIKELATGKVLAQRTEHLQWMPKSNLYYYTRNGVDGRQLITVDPLTGKETILANKLPEGYFQVAPTEDWLLYSLTQEGPKERKEIYEVIEPDDRQPGWRDRSYLAKYDLQNGLMQPLTFGFHNAWALDIAPDGRSVLMMTSHSRLTQRPTTLSNLYKLDVQTLKAETLVENDGFLSGAKFSPDGSQILLTGSPEALDGIGLNLPEGLIPNQYDYQMYLMNLADKKITPVTKDFYPSVQQTIWNKVDGQIYFTAENRDYISLYRMNPKDGKIEQLESKEDLVKNITLADQAPVLAYYGQGAMNSDRLYTLDTKKGKTALVEDLSQEILKDVQLGECHAWNFVSSRGDTIYGRYYLPPHFDASKKYPMIVNYYGGCSPTERNFESRYPHHAYAALGYVVYVVLPSGASGFGQEFGSRHVNTAGEGPAQDIIEGTKKFCEEHSFVNAKKIGCIGASYGGFMTQYLQTKTDIFAAAISHAGISDHTSYWGEGYWGYSYSEVSMANSYPWTRKDLYVDRSPLFNADKIHTPLLFVHGDKDMNVPVGESIQMYTALKLLGRETAMVLVTGQDHHIVDYGKRIQWQNTIWAWFAKWLQDDPTWWNAIYTPKAL